MCEQLWEFQSSHCNGKSHSVGNEIILNCLKRWGFVSNHDSLILLPALSLLSTIPKPGPTSWMMTTLFHQGERRNPRNRAELQLAAKWFEFWANFLETVDRTDWFKTTKGPSQVDPEKQQATQTMPGL